MLTKRNIFLIGPMGSGKTAVGRHLARALKFPFHDSDTEIEARTGVDIAFIFEKEGESGFRVREHEVIDQLTLLQPIVLATGGGAVLRAGQSSGPRRTGLRGLPGDFRTPADGAHATGQASSVVAQHRSRNRASMS